MSKRNKVIAVLVVIVISFLVFFYILKNIKYSISEITADNYDKILNVDYSQSLNERASISDFFHNPLIFIDGKKIIKI
jgi:predicted AAA+ superfamily ATPase